MLSRKTGAEFDKAYVQAQVSGHEKMQQLLAAEATNGKDPDLKMFAGRPSRPSRSTTRWRWICRRRLESSPTNSNDQSGAKRAATLVR